MSKWKKTPPIELREITIELLEKVADQIDAYKQALRNKGYTQEQIEEAFDSGGAAIIKIMKDAKLVE